MEFVDLVDEVVDATLGHNRANKVVDDEADDKHEQQVRPDNEKGDGKDDQANDDEVDDKATMKMKMT